MSNQVSLAVSGVTLSYRTRWFGSAWRDVLDGVQFEVEPGEIAVLIGENGSGKTTLLKAISGLLEPRRGKILLNTQSPQNCQVGYLPQGGCVAMWRRAIDEAALILEIVGIPSSQRYAVATEMLQKLQFDAPLESRSHQLSGGQRQKIALCRCLVAAPYVDLLVFDEPTTFLDAKTQQYLSQQLPCLLQKTPCPVVVATHDDFLVGALDGKRFLIKDGLVHPLGQAHVD